MMNITDEMVEAFRKFHHECKRLMINIESVTVDGYGSIPPSDVKGFNVIQIYGVPFKISKREEPPKKKKYYQFMYMTLRDCSWCLSPVLVDEEFKNTEGVEVMRGSVKRLIKDKVFEI